MDEISLTNNKRIGTIDTSKGIATICVIVGHLTTRSDLINQYIYSWHMPMFFIASGILLSYKNEWDNKSFKQLFLEKTRKLLFPYYTLSIITVLISLITRGIGEATHEILLTVTCEGITTLWYFPALLIAILFCFLVLKIPNKASRFFVVFLSVIATYLFSLIDFFHVDGLRLYIVLRMINIVCRGIIGGIFVYLGYCVYLLYKKILFRSKKLLYYIMLIFLFINLLLFRLNNVDLHYSIIGNPVLFYINAISGSCFVLLFSILIFSKDKLLSYLGRNSLVIFSTQYNFQIISISVFISRFILCCDQYIIQIILVIAIELVLTVFFNKHLDFILSHDAFLKCITRNRKYCS